MGCSSSEPISSNIYTILFCSLVPIKEKNNTYKINLIAQEELQKLSEKKFFDQAYQSEQKTVIEFLQRENFNKKTIFYFYCKNKLQIKNLYQMINLIPYNYEDLNRIIILSTEKVKGFYNCLIEKKTINIEYYKFIGSIIDLNDMQEILENINDINVTKDDINYDEEENEENNELFINGLIDEEKAKNLKNEYNKNIIKLLMSEIKLKNKTIFSNIINFFLNKDIKQFSLYDTNINENALFYSILDLFDNNFNIRKIVLHNCNLTDDHLSDLLRAISDKRIRYLNLSKNALTVVGATFISDFLLVNKTLQELNISYNDNVNFKAEGIKYIMRSMVQSPNIKLIDFSGMNLTGCGEYIAKVLEVSQTLENVILKDDFLNANDFKNIFEKIKINKYIKEIDISYNDMGGNKSLEYIRDSIKENNSLIILKMDKININNDNYNIIFEGIENNKNISCYSISYNKINPKIVLEFFIKQMQVKDLIYIPYDKNNPEDKNKDFSLDEKKILEKYKTERPDLNIVNMPINYN